MPERQRDQYHPLPKGLGGHISPEGVDSRTYRTVSPDFQSMKDIVTPGFHKLRKEGAIINNPFSKMELQSMYSGTYSHVYSGGSYVHDAVSIGSIILAPRPVSVPTQFQSLIDAAVYSTSMKAKADIGKSKANLLVTMGELRETTEFMRGIYNAFCNGFAAYLLKKNTVSQSLRDKRAHVSNWQKALATGSGDAASFWMQYRYAVMPLYYEAKAYLDAWSKDLQPRATARAREVVTDSTSSVRHFPDDKMVWTVEDDMSIHATVRAGVLYDNPSGLGEAWVQKYGLTRPATAALELTKFSWLVGWFIDVNSWLASLEPQSLCKEHARWVTVKGAVYGNSRVTDMKWAVQPAKDESAHCSASLSYVLHFHYRLTEFPLHTYPPINVHLNWMRSIDSLAILRQLIRR